jgi:glutathione synthase
MQVAFIVDPLPQLQVGHDTSIALMEALQKRGHRIFCLGLADLYWDQGETWGSLEEIRLDLKADPWYEVKDRQLLPLSQMQAVWMRKDPPVDTAYLYATYLLDRLSPSRTLVLNHPAGIRSANEKLYALQFQEWIPRTRVSSNKRLLRQFVEQEGQAVLKPLGGKGGEGILRVNAGDPNLNSLIEMSTQFGRLPVMVQEYLPQAAAGDKRILLLEGEPLGAVNRIPGDPSAPTAVAKADPRWLDRCLYFGNRASNFPAAPPKFLLPAAALAGETDPGHRCAPKYPPPEWPPPPRPRAALSADPPPVPNRRNPTAPVLWAHPLLPECAAATLASRLL